MNLAGLCTIDVFSLQSTIAAVCIKPNLAQILCSVKQELPYLGRSKFRILSKGEQQQHCNWAAA